MIHPSDIRRKANRLYPMFLDAWLAGEPFFPRFVPCEMSAGGQMPPGGRNEKQPF